MPRSAPRTAAVSPMRLYEWGSAKFIKIGGHIPRLDVANASDWHGSFRIGVETIALKIRSAGDVAAAFEELNDRADAVYVVGETLTSANSGRINTFALAARLPTSHNNYDRLDPGGFMSYGPHFPSLYRRAAEMVDKILRGMKPVDIPIEQPTRYDLVFNLTTAKALRVKIPESLLPRADKLIE